MDSKKKKLEGINLLWTNIANLIKVKTLITLAFVALLISTTIMKIEVPNEIMMLATSVTTYFFTKPEKQSDGKNREESDYDGC